MNEANTPAAQELIRLGPLEIRYLQKAGNGSEMGMFEMRVPPASMVPPPHSHPGNEELVYVLEGTLRYTVGSETRDLRAGDFMSTPQQFLADAEGQHFGPREIIGKELMNGKQNFQGRYRPLEQSVCRLF